MIKRLSIILFILGISLSATFGQEVKPYGYFLNDSVKIGELVPYSLSFKDKRNRAIIFPDSTFDFSPFELFDKAYFDTESDTINSIDSAVYYLATFEIDTVQMLSLPVFLYTGDDSLEIFAEQDSIILDQVVTQMPDSVALEETAAFQPVATEFNYPYWIIALVTLGIISLVVLLVWGKQIRNRIKLYYMHKRLTKFYEQFEHEIAKISNGSSQHDIELVLKFWKEYMERLESIPYTKLTTKELVTIQKNASLEETLKSIDRSIYSKIKIEVLQDDFDFLKDYATDRYNHITEDIRNA